MKVLAIDPGYERMGIAILEKKKGKKEVLVHSECFKTSSTRSFTDRLNAIGKTLNSLIKKHRPDALAIETLYFSSNQKTAMSVAEVRGMILYIAGMYNMAVFEYTPLQVKMAITGYGRADKKQMTAMVENIIAVKKEIKYDDEFDAIAIGITCLVSEKRP